jgi:L-2-hydroxycarboxylate dehydrogenase (NAD+)
MKIAIDKAKRYGLGAVAVKNATHFGIAGYYPLMAASEGLMGFAFTNARPSIAPTFGTEPMLGTNPIAFAAPSDMDYPFCFDGATSIAQRGKIEVADRAEKPVPAGWVIDDQGQPMTNATDILKAIPKFQASLLPLGGAGEEFAGYKGYGLAAIVEILSASLSGGPFMKDLLGFEEDGSRRPHMLGHFFLAIDIEHFLPVEISRKITGDIMRALQASQKAPGSDRIYVAGEKEYEKEKQIRELGIPVNANLLKTLRMMRDKLHVEGYDAYF